MLLKFPITVCIPRQLGRKLENGAPGGPFDKNKIEPFAAALTWFFNQLAIRLSPMTKSKPLTL